MSVTTRYKKDGTDIGTYFCDLTNTQTVAGTKTFSTTPIVGTMGTSDSSTSAASTEYVKNQAYATLASPTFTGTVTVPAPASDSNTTVAATTAFVISKVPSLTAYATSASPTFTGTVTVPAPASDSNTTVAATTAFVISKVPSLTAYATLASPTFTGTVTTANISVSGNVVLSGTVAHGPTVDLQYGDVRITDVGGNPFQLGSKNASGSQNLWLFNTYPTTTTYGAYHLSFRNYHTGSPSDWSNEIFIFGANGNFLAAGTALGGSDYRIKKVVGTAPPVLERLCKLNVYKYLRMINYEGPPDKLLSSPPENFTGNQIGFFAHEIQELFPEIDTIVDGEKDSVDNSGNMIIQTVDMHQFSRFLLKAIQELNEKLETQQKLIDSLINSESNTK